MQPTPAQALFYCENYIDELFGDYRSSLGKGWWNRSSHNNCPNIDLPTEYKLGKPTNKIPAQRFPASAARMPASPTFVCVMIIGIMIIIIIIMINTCPVQLRDNWVEAAVERRGRPMQGGANLKSMSALSSLYKIIIIRFEIHPPLLVARIGPTWHWKASRVGATRPWSITWSVINDQWSIR